MPPNAFRVIGQLSHIKASVCACVCIYRITDTQKAEHSCFIFVKPFFFFLIGRRVVVTYRPHKLLQPESCLSSQRRHVAEVQHHQDRALVPGWGLCSPRCECPTTSLLLMYIWKKKAIIHPKTSEKR